MTTAATSGWGRRHTLVLLCTSGLVLAYTDRVNMAVASIAMRDEFGWNQTVKGLVLSAFFVGYLLALLPAGMLAARFGGRRVLAVAAVWWSLCTLLTPLAASVSLSALIVVRIALGLGEAAVLPAVYDLFSRWVPPAERGRSMARFLGGTPLGQVVGFTGAGLLTAHYGWPASFVVFGALGFVWVLVWLARVADDPADARGLSAAERALLATGADARSSTAAAGVPWRRLLTAPALWAIVAAIFAGNWALFMLLSWLPSYFRDVHGLAIASTGLYSAAPWAASFLGMQLAGIAADAMIRRGVRTLNVRRLMTAISLLGLATCLLWLREVRSADLALLLMCLAMLLSGAGVAGCFVGPLDLAPRHASVLIGFVNTLGTIPGIAGVAVTGWLIDVTRGYDAAFLLSAALAIAATLMYLWHASAEPIDA